MLNMAQQMAFAFKCKLYYEKKTKHKNIYELCCVKKNGMQHTQGCVEAEHTAFVIEKIFTYSTITSITSSLTHIRSI